MQHILVTGGAGYIGAHMVQILLERGFAVTVVDTLENGHIEAVNDGARFLRGDIGDAEFLESVFSCQQIDAVMNFASYTIVGESVSDPAKYYNNNISKTLVLLDVMRKYNVEYFIFSSTAAIFGEPEYTPINELHPKNPVNPYGASKLLFERILSDYKKSYGLKYGSLRYFNACGADPKSRIGERHDPETHLIPLVLRVASGRMDSIKVFGNDYETPDGTCVRDYIHILDLCEAHLLLLQYLKNNGQEAEFNLGTGKGYSVKEVIDVASEITGKEIKAIQSGRREGDPSILIADGSMAKEILGWQPLLSDLKTIITHAWDWEQKLVEIEKVLHEETV